ncbi:hypothetical protein BS47DRAFT_1395871 [Hydnum rufescens UP504]|uniref:Uncharacterized protein n=1 Tax=Hydnum rufescens UP504 TaxID=1448309 RepID=A0A9P6ARX2_9AGAM|nr:hypothetical protein BS47DRAFT_1395871 [Hydnum rufescens UP504]
MGMDETLIGTIFTYPVSQADSQWLEELLEDGVPTFGVVKGPMQSGVRSIKELPEGVQVAAPEGRVLPTMVHFLQDATEVEIASQIDRLSLEDSNPSTHIPSVPINDSVNDTEDLYAKFWDQSSEGLPYDDYSDISSYDLTPSDAVVKSTRVAKIGERQKQKRVEAEAINEAAQLLSKAQKGDQEAKAEIIRRINAEHGRKNGVRSRDGKPPASPGREKRLCWQTAEIAEVNAQARLVKTPAGDAQETNASLPGSGTQVQIQHPTPAPAHSPPPTHPLQICDREWILIFPPITTVLPIPILIPILDLAPLPITLIVPGFPTILLSSILPSMMLHVPLLLLQLQAYNPASQYQLVPGHFQTLQTLGLFHQLAKAQWLLSPIGTSYAFKNGLRDSCGTSPLNTPSLQEEGVQTSLNFKKSTLPVPSAVGTLIMLPFPVKAPNSTAPPVEHPSSSAEPFEQVPLGQWFYIEWGPLTESLGSTVRDENASQEMNKNRFKNLKTCTANVVAHPYIAPVDLLYVDEVYACAGSKLECDALLACGPPPIKTPEDFKMEFLDYVQHPPRLPEAITQYPPPIFLLENGICK